MSKNASKVNIFLIELLIGVMFLAVCSAVCIKFFAAAHTASEESRRLNESAVLCSSAAEAFKSVNADKNETAALLEGKYDVSSDELVVYYDENFEPCAEDGAAYILGMGSFEQSGNVIKTVITMQKPDGGAFFEMEAAVYVM